MLHAIQFTCSKSHLYSQKLENLSVQRVKCRVNTRQRLAVFTSVAGKNTGVQRVKTPVKTPLSNLTKKKLCLEVLHEPMFHVQWPHISQDRSSVTLLLKRPSQFVLDDLTFYISLICLTRLSCFFLNDFIVPYQIDMNGSAMK